MTTERCVAVDRCVGYAGPMEAFYCTSQSGCLARRKVKEKVDAAYRAGREEAAREIESGGAYRIVKICRYAKSVKVSGSCVDHICETAAGHGYPWHKCACGAMYRDKPASPQRPGMPG